MSLHANDLKYMLVDTFEIDSYGSKMGADSDVVTVSFSLKEKDPAKDLVKFLEAGYPFILDADVSPGELQDGMYKVFVEIERDRRVADNINEMLDGVRKISGVDSLKFRYHKNFKSREATLENLGSVPNSPSDYELTRNTVTMENYKEFFSNSYLEEAFMLGDVLTLKKSYADPLQFKILEFGNSDDIYHGLNESYNINAFDEVLFLTKYVGDYTISKYGHKVVFERDDHMLVTERL
jgi:hypothetical protein